MTNLTKKIEIDDDALQIIAGMEWEVNGRVIGRLTCGQLDRKLYQEVNKGLDALGGKWDRRVNGHVFTADPREGIAALLDNGHVTVERDGFFETPLPVIEQMLGLLEHGVRIPVLEPSAGLGAIASVIRERFGVGKWDIAVVEKNVSRLEVLYSKGFAVSGGDFLEYFPNRRFPTVIMNPPFEAGQDVEHVVHAFNHCLADGGELVSVMSAGVTFRQEAKYRDFRSLVKWCGRIVELPPHSFKESGTMVSAVLVYLRKWEGARP